MPLKEHNVNMMGSCNKTTRAVVVLSLLVAALIPQVAQSRQTIAVNECTDLAALIRLSSRGAELPLE